MGTKNIKSISHNHEYIKGYYRMSLDRDATERHISESRIQFGIYHKKGGTIGEISVGWILLDKITNPHHTCVLLMIAGRY